MGYTIYIIRDEVRCVYLLRIKKARAEGKKCHGKTMMSRKTSLKYTTTVPQWVFWRTRRKKNSSPCSPEHGGKRTKEGSKRGMGRLEQVKRG
jgi:hypothetical protein